MPSPIGHAVAGLTAGWLIAPPAATRRTVGLAAFDAFVFALAGAAADVDLLFGAHSGPTHGLGAAAIAGGVAGLLGVGLHSRRRASVVAGPHPIRKAVIYALAVMAAYASHTLLDWLGTDSAPPIGIMALWPVNRTHYEASWHLFMGISRQYWLPDFWSHNTRALAREMLILVPLLGVAWRLRRPVPPPSER